MSSRLIAAAVLLAALWYGSTAYTAHKQAQAAAAQAAAERAAYEAAAKNTIAAIHRAVAAIEAYKVPKDEFERALIPLALPELEAVGAAMDRVRVVYPEPLRPWSFNCLVKAREDLWNVWDRTTRQDAIMLQPARMRLDANLAAAEAALKAGK